MPLVEDPFDTGFLLGMAFRVSATSVVTITIPARVSTIPAVTLSTDLRRRCNPRMAIVAPLLARDKVVIGFEPPSCWPAVFTLANECLRPIRPPAQLLRQGAGTALAQPKRARRPAERPLSGVDESFFRRQARQMPRPARSGGAKAR